VASAHLGDKRSEIRRSRAISHIPVPKPPAATAVLGGHNASADIADATSVATPPRAEAS